MIYELLDPYTIRNIQPNKSRISEAIAYAKRTIHPAQLIQFIQFTNKINKLKSKLLSFQNHPSFAHAAYFFCMYVRNDIDIVKALVETKNKRWISLYAAEFGIKKDMKPYVADWVTGKSMSNVFALIDTYQREES